MTGTQRRQQIIWMIEQARELIPAHRLAEIFSVSRKAVVQIGKA